MLIGKNLNLVPVIKEKSFVRLLKMTLVGTRMKDTYFVSAGGSKQKHAIQFAPFRFVRKSQNFQKHRWWICPVPTITVRLHQFLCHSAHTGNLSSGLCLLTSLWEVDYPNDRVPDSESVNYSGTGRR